MALIKDPRKIFVLLIVILILAYAMLRIKRRAYEAYNQQKMEGHSKITDQFNQYYCLT